MEPGLGNLESAAQEAANAHVRRTTGRALVVTAVMILGLAAMASIIRVSGAVIGIGTVVVESDVKKVSHLNGGVVAEVYARNGDRIAANAPLIRLDTTVAGVSSTVSKRGVAQLLAQKARLEAVTTGRNSIDFPALATGEGAQAVQAERRLFDLETAERVGTTAQLDERIRQTQRQIDGYERQLASLRQQMELIRPELDGVRSLWARRLVTINRLNQLERTAVDLQGRQGELEASIAQARSRIAEIREQKIQLRATERKNAAELLAEVKTRLDDQQVRVASAGDQFDRSIIRSPIAGTVDKLAMIGPGSVVAANEPLAEIVPTADKMVVEAHIGVTDIDKVQVGQAARITFSAFNQQTTPQVDGVVTWTSAERYVDERTGMGYYKVRVRIGPGAIDALGGLKLVPGMPSEIYIHTGKRSLMSYLTKPLVDQITRAFRESL